MSSHGEFWLKMQARRLLWEGMVQVHMCEFLLAFGQDRFTEPTLRRWMELINEVHGPKGAKERWRIKMLVKGAILTFVCDDPRGASKRWWRDLTSSWPTDAKTGKILDEPEKD
jgi:hypothetical protein